MTNKLLNAIEPFRKLIAQVMSGLGGFIIGYLIAGGREASVFSKYEDIPISIFVVGDIQSDLLEYFATFMLLGIIISVGAFFGMKKNVLDSRVLIFLIGVTCAFFLKGYSAWLAAENIVANVIN